MTNCHSFIQTPVIRILPSFDSIIRQSTNTVIRLVFGLNKSTNRIFGTAVKQSDYNLVVRLFPLPERGMNPYAQTLTEAEIEVCTVLLSLHYILVFLA